MVHGLGKHRKRDMHLTGEYPEISPVVLFSSWLLVKYINDAIFWIYPLIVFQAHTIQWHMQGGHPLATWIQGMEYIPGINSVETTRVQVRFIAFR